LLTARPEWGAEITERLHCALADAHDKYGLKCALRVTPTDIHDQERPPQLRSCPAWEALNRSIELCIGAGADIISIESVGGKELHDEALLY
jgi:methanol--5-hydroxybenzimidazolylcobamide Co-methyltransferase